MNYLDDDVEDNLDESEYAGKNVVYNMLSFGADHPVDGLVKRLKRGDIYRPTFQRNFVWSHKQASKFIESILLGLPIPGIFLYKEEQSGKLLIVDGLQRLTSLLAFTEGSLILSSKKKVPFELIDVSRRFEGATYETLSEEDQRRFDDFVIHATIVQQVTPERDTSSAYYIFERLNTGGTPLQPQEIRSAIFIGELQQTIEEINNLKIWRDFFGPVHNRGKDQELILRFFAFKYELNNYRAPMKEFLNGFMEKHRDMRFLKRDLMFYEFEESLKYILEKIGKKAFRPTRSLNAAAFDSIMVATSQNISKLSQIHDFKVRYKNLMSNQEYIKSITRSTADESSVIYRFDTARNELIL